MRYPALRSHISGHAARVACIAALALSALGAAPLGAQDSARAGAPPKLTAPLPVDPAITTGVLPNGLRYYIRVNHRPEKRAELRLVVNAGSVLEDSSQRGLAHMVEHMAFSGTTHFKKQALVDYLESTGVRFGADLNASTSFDETIYELTVPTDSVKLFDKGFQILADWSRGLTFDSTELARERKVVIEEWRLGRGAAARMRDKQFPVVFSGSRYAQRIPIGDKHTLETAPRAQVKRFYDEWYRPDLMAVVAVGDFDKAKVERMIKAQFASWPAKKGERARPSFPVPDHDSTLVTIATDSEATRSTVAVYYLQPLQPQKTVGDFRTADARLALQRHAQRAAAGDRAAARRALHRRVLESGAAHPLEGRVRAHRARAGQRRRDRSARRRYRGRARGATRLHGHGARSRQARDAAWNGECVRRARQDAIGGVRVRVRGCVPGAHGNTEHRAAVLALPAAHSGNSAAPR